MNVQTSNIRLPRDLSGNPNFISEFYALDNGSITPNTFFMNNLTAYTKIFNLTRSNGININDLQNSQISAIIISLYKLGMN